MFGVMNSEMMAVTSVKGAYYVKVCLHSQEGMVLLNLFFFFN